MKKITALLIAIIMMTSVITSFPFAANAVTHGYLAGDANDDGDVSMKDVLLVRRFIAGLASEKDLSRLAADVYRDSDVNSRDVLKLRRTIAGLDDYEQNNTDGKYRVSEIKIGGRNISRFTIVLPASAPDGYLLSSMNFAAGELQKYIKQACGIKLNISTDDTPDGYKILYRYDLDDEYELGKEGFVLEVTGEGDFVITCGTLRGALYGTYTFLEDEIGYRFLTDGVTYLYRNGTVDVPATYRDRQVPTFDYRAIGANGPGANFPMLKENASDGGAYLASKNNNDIDYNAYNLGGAVGTTYLHAHSFVYYMAGFANKDDPSLNSVAGGEQPCMTSEDTYNKIIDFMYQLVEWRYELGQIPGIHYTQLSCSANDNGNFCTCPECMKVYREEESVAGVLIRLCNRVTEKFCGDYPELEVYTAAYAGSHIPPKMTRPDPRLNICMCCVGCNNHNLRDSEACRECGGNTRLETALSYEGEKVPQSNVEWMGWLDGWLELTDNVWFWYYTDNWVFYVSSAPNLFNFYDDIKFLAEKGVKGLYLEGDADVINYTFEELRIYLMTKMMWDAGMSEEEYVALMDEFLMIYYGPGWENIKELIYMENYCGDLEGCFTNNFDYPWEEYNKEYFRDNYGHFVELLTAASAAAENGTQRDRIERLSVHVHFLGLSATFDRDWRNGDASSRARYRERYEWLWNYYNNHPRFLALNTTFVASEDGIGGMWNFPSNANNPCDPMNWLFDGGDFTGTRR